MQPVLKPSNLARLGKVDVRRDEEQNIKLSQTIKLFIDAGYFRARVKGLSPFDKIVGGMTWCIESCNFDIDVDLLFHDSLTIGQKIALTERIVKVLPYMKCPYSIEPHQIQGLDAIHIYPVVQWLVNQARETRAQYQDETRIISLNEFQRHYGYCLQCPGKQEQLRRQKHIDNVRLTYGPKRRFKRKDGTEEAVEDFAAPVMTLLEYSEAQGTPQLRPDSDTESIDEEDEDVRRKLQEKLYADANLSTRSSSKAVSSIVENQVEDIARATENYLRLEEKEKMFASKELLTSMEKRVMEIKKEKERKSMSLQALMEAEKEAEQEVINTREQLEDLAREMKSVQNIDLVEKEETLKTLSQLLEANESAKKVASQFKEKCRQEAEEIRQQTSKITEELEKEDLPVDEDHLHALSSEEQRVKKLRELVAVKTREIEGLKRVIDDIPGRAELSQYQKRFVELYNLVAAAHHETLQFYNMYNALSDSRNYMEKESDLLNSILDNMERGLSTSSSLDEYVTQLKGIIDGITQNKTKLESKRTEAKGEKSTLSTQLTRLQDLQLHYTQLLHLFSQEIANNEILLEKFDQ